MHRMSRPELFLVFAVVAASNVFHTGPARAADAGACGVPPLVADEELKGAIEGEAQLLFKRLGDAKLSGQIETSRRDIFLKAPQGAQAAADRALFVAGCTIIMQDTTLSTDQKLDRLQRLRNGFSVAAPTAGSVLGGWLRYAIGPCRRQGEGVVRCEGRLENTEVGDRALATFVSQKSGIRNTGFDKFGLITAIDNEANTYKATRVQVGNRSNDETGQFGFKLLSGLPTPFSVDFNNVDSSASSFFRLTLPLADGATASGSRLEMIIQKIALE